MNLIKFPLHIVSYLVLIVGKLYLYLLYNRAVAEATGLFSEFLLYES